MGIIPQDGIRLNLPANPTHDKIVTAVLIEWREVRAVGDKIMEHPRMSIAKIIAIHGAPEDFIQRSYTHTRKDYGPHSIPPTPWEPKTDWEQDPQAYLEEALHFLRM